MPDRSLRHNKGKVSYCEYDDGDFESPVKKGNKKRIIESDSEVENDLPKGTLPFARNDKASENESLEKRKKKRFQTARSRQESKKEASLPQSDPMEETDSIEDEDSEEERKPIRSRPGRASSPPSSDIDDIDEPASSSEDDEPEADDEESEEDDIETSESENDDDDDIVVAKRSMARSRSNTKAPSIAKTQAQKCGQGPRRSTRAAAVRINYAQPFNDNSDEEDDDDGNSNSTDDDSSSDDDLADGKDGVDNTMYVDGGDAFDDEDDWDLNDEEALLQNIEKILSSRKESSGTDSFRVKLKGKSYRNTRWIPRAMLWSSAQRGVQSLVRNFEKRRDQGLLDPYNDLEDGVHPTWLDVERIVTHIDTQEGDGDTRMDGEDEEHTAKNTKFLVKWRGLSYSESTWEHQSVLSHSDRDTDAIRRYFTYTKDALARSAKMNREAGSGGGDDNDNDGDDESTRQQGIDITAIPTFCNGRSLRDYQQESLRWMATHWYNNQNCILGDEMGLGKTAQSISVLSFQQQFGNSHGPFLVIAPLTTLGHWQREIEVWTNMNCVLYAGSSADRDLIKKYELWVAPEKKNDGDGRRRSKNSSIVKPNVVLSSYEMVLRDQELFHGITWETIIIDEAHRMKATSSSTRTAIAAIPTYWLLLLTGTPVQNNMRELFGLLNLIDPAKYNSEQTFLSTYGDDRTGITPAQVRALQGTLRPLLLRRMKEDVETLPEKEECIIWVQLTADQRAYYKAIFEGQIGTLLAGSSTKNLPNLRNLAMELRKVCCHPYLCDGLEEDSVSRRIAAGLPLDPVASLVGSSGKMLLLHKLLPKLRAEGHKVLIFSQFKMMLDVLEDYLNLAGHPFERIDGSTSSRDRQAAIDRYSKEGSDGFVFLLSTRAGGQGITLTAADTCIIYDSDWNPQNDLQAMARCHRIGQEKDVTIYRLVSKETYEEHVFHTSSKKYGLDEAILGGMGNQTATDASGNGGAGGSGGAGGGGGTANPEADSKKLADLLKHGAHCLATMEAAAKETEAFASEDIDEILKGRTEKRQIGGRAGNTFSVATFDVGSLSRAAPTTQNTAGGSKSGGDGDDENAFWTALLPDAAAAHQEQLKAASMPVILPPRQKKRIDYSERNGGGVRRRNQDDDDDDGQLGNRKKQKKNKGAAGDNDDEDYSSSSDAEEGTKSNPHSQQRQRRKKEPKPPAPRLWTRTDVELFFNQILRVGFHRSKQAATELQLAEKRGGYPAEEIEQVAAALGSMLKKAVAVAPKPVPRRTTTEYGMPCPYEKDIRQFESDVIAKTPVIREIALSEGPANAHKALSDGKTIDRLLRNCFKYQLHLDELTSMTEALEKKHYVPLRSTRGLPMWWGRDELHSILRGCRTLGFECTNMTRKMLSDVEAILIDPRYGFPDKVCCDMDKVDAAVPVEKKEGIDAADASHKEDGEKGTAPLPTTNTNNDVVVAPAAANAAPVAGEKAIETVPRLPSNTDASLPRRLSPTEWHRFKEAILKQLRAALVDIHEQSVKRKLLWRREQHIYGMSKAAPTMKSTAKTTTTTAATTTTPSAATTSAGGGGRDRDSNEMLSRSGSWNSHPRPLPVTTANNNNNNNNNTTATTMHGASKSLMMKAIHNNAAKYVQGSSNAMPPSSAPSSAKVAKAKEERKIDTHTPNDGNNDDDDIVISIASEEEEEGVGEQKSKIATPATAFKNGAVERTSDAHRMNETEEHTPVVLHNTTTNDIARNTVYSNSHGPTINVFDETRGGFTDPLSVGEKMNGDESVGNEKKRTKTKTCLDGSAVLHGEERGEGARGGASGSSHGGGKVHASVNGMRQRSLFEMKKVKVMKRTVNGIEEADENENVVIDLVD